MEPGWQPSRIIGSPRTSRWAAGLSVLVHLLAVLAWMRPQLPSLPRAEPPSITVDIVPPATKGDGREIERPHPSQPQPEAKQIPQLEAGTLSDKPVPRQDSSGGSGQGTSVNPAKKELVTQNERDLVLSQVLRGWKPPKELQAYESAEFKVQVTVLADGTLAPPFSARLPYNPAAAIEGFAGLHPQDPRRKATEAFYKALRQAQPLKLPPHLAAKAPFPVMLDFRVKDVR